MTNVREIEKAIASLPERDYTRFRQWFLKRDWAQWDREIEDDSRVGRLDFLRQEAAAAKVNDRLREL